MSKHVWLQVSKAGGGQTVAVWKHEPTLCEMADAYREYLADSANGEITAGNIGWNCCVEKMELRP